METEEVEVRTVSPRRLPPTPVVALPADPVDSLPRRGGRRRQWPWPRTALMAIGSLMAVAGLVFGVVNHDRLQRTDDSIAAIRADLHRTGEQVATARIRLIKAERASGAAANSLTAASSQLGTVQGQLSAAQANIRLDGINIADLNACVAGVNQALNEISLGDDAGAAAILGRYATRCQAAEPSR